jgi:hypothetical protein
MRDRTTRNADSLPRDGKRAPRGAKSKRATLERRKARQAKHARQGR